MLWTSLFVLLMIAALPLFALLYGRSELIAPGIVLALAVPGAALQAPVWIAYRQMRFVRERTLLAVEPVTGFVVTIVLGIAGAGVWSLVIGGFAGHWTAAAVALKTSPYRFRFNFDRTKLREYFSFSWPLLIASGSGVLVIQVAVTLGESTVGLAGVGAIGLAATVARFSAHVDAILTRTIYPAICAVRDRADLLFESFVKSNRLALMWGMPFGIALTLFAPDLVRFGLGEKWELATELLQVLGAVAAAQQIAFNWTAYFRAVGDTRPMAVNGVLSMATFLILAFPLMHAHGLRGYAITLAAMTVVDLACRTYFLTRLFSGFEMARHAARAMAPTVPAVAVVLLARAAEGERESWMVVAELVAYAGVTIAATWIAERKLLREVLGYLRPRAKAPSAV
jgi:O-antigen/teichoic acid export membrane protein